MSTLTAPAPLTPLDVEIAGERDAKLYELIDGELKEKVVGFKSQLIAGLIIQHLNAQFYPHEGAAAGEAMIYCFNGRNHGRKPDVVYVRMNRLPNGDIPDGDLMFAPDLVVEVLSPSNSGYEVEETLQEYLSAGIALVWIVHPDRRTVRVYRQDGTTKLFRHGDVIENEPALPGFRLLVGDVFPPVPATP